MRQVLEGKILIAYPAFTEHLSNSHNRERHWKKVERWLCVCRQDLVCYPCPEEDVSRCSLQRW